LVALSYTMLDRLSRPDEIIAGLAGTAQYYKRKNTSRSD
jgi:hypothetical protein